VRLYFRSALTGAWADKPLRAAEAPGRACRRTPLVGSRRHTIRAWAAGKIAADQAIFLKNPGNRSLAQSSVIYGCEVDKIHVSRELKQLVRPETLDTVG
jgi:hypothetical protein